MTKHSYILLVLAGLLLSGCGPFSESLVKRADVADEIEGGMEVAASATVPSENKQQTANDRRLDWATRDAIRSYGPTIKKFSRKYGFDWRFTLAVIKAESSFIDSAESEKGAMGLMQIMPETQDEVARVLEVENVVEPQNNIRAGIFYLRRMYRMFDGADEKNRLRLALAAYNAGAGRVFDAQDIAKYLNNDPNQWESVKQALQLLSSRYYTLHQNVWLRQKPTCGSFGAHGQTIAYVEKIMNYYDQYRLVLN